MFRYTEIWGLYYKTFYGRNLWIFVIVCLSLAILSNLVECMWVRPGDYPREEHLKGASFGYAPALLGNIRLSWKGLPQKNNLAYYENP